MIGAPLLLRLFAILCFLAPTTPWADETKNAGDSTIHAPFGGSEIAVHTGTRFAGAIDSLTWKGKEFIDCADHGRELQSASAFDLDINGNSEVFNPTEAGSRDDGAGATSTSRLLEFKASAAEFQTLTQMAFWLQPGEQSGGRTAANSTALSNHRLAREVRIGVYGLPNVIDYTVRFILPADETHHYAQFEALTGYMPAEFSRFWHWDAKSGKLQPLAGGPPAEPGPAEQNDPIVFSTEDGSHAMGIFAEPTPGSVGPTYGRFRFIPERVTKWNCVFRVERADGVPPGEYRYHMFVPVGTLADVEAAIAILTRKEK